MNAWAAAVAALLGWRERQVMGIEDALGRLGPRWVDLLHRNHGLPAAEKAAFLAAAGLVADPPVKYEPDDLEMLLRENGPLWVTDDDRGARLFSPKAYLITGIRGTGRREAQLEVVDAATGRGGAMRLSRLMQRLGGPRGRMQVLHMGQGAPNREAPAPEPEPVMQQAIYSSAMNPALIIAGAGLGFQIVKEMLNATPDITVTRARLNGEVNPNDDPSWAGRGDWQKASFPVREGRFENQLSDQQSVDFTVEFQYNGHSLSDIGVKLGATNDAYGWRSSRSSRTSPSARTSSTPRTTWWPPRSCSPTATRRRSATTSSSGLARSYTATGATRSSRRPSRRARRPRHRSRRR